eukprot:Skav206372  [mRNA]  locus=scaffold834:132002:133032:+ [translate_table: standard]
MSLTDGGLVRRERSKWHQQWRVKCDSTKGAFQLQTSPETSPQGVRRFLDLAIFHAVRDSRVQFGISDNRDLNEKWSPNIQDDAPLAAGVGVFRKGTLSFAGTGPHSRNTQIFITLSDQTGKLGKNPWEAPIGHVVEEDLPILDSWKFNHDRMYGYSIF